MLTTLLLIIGLHATDTIPYHFTIGTGPIPNEIARLRASPQWDIRKCFPCNPQATPDSCSFKSFSIYESDTWVTVCDSTRIIIHGDTVRLVRELINMIDQNNKREMERPDPSMVIKFYRNRKLVKTVGGSDKFSLFSKDFFGSPFKVDGKLIKTDSILIRIK